MQSLFLVHCGFYDGDISEGIFESHSNLFVVASSFEEARARVKQQKIFQSKRMHVDGIQQIISVQGWKIALEQSSDDAEDTVLISNAHRELAQKS